MDSSAYLQLEENGTLTQIDDINEFSHEPITHQVENDKHDREKFKKFVRNIEMKERKKTIQKTQQIKKQLLEAQIAAKNFRSQLLRPSTQQQTKKQVKKVYKSAVKHQNGQSSQKGINVQRNQKSISSDLFKLKQQEIQRIKVPALKGQPYVNKEKLMKKPLFGSVNGDKEKENRVKQPPKEFSGIRLRNLKLPELSVSQGNSVKKSRQVRNSAEQKGQVQKKQENIQLQTVCKESQIKKRQKWNKKKQLSRTRLINPVLRTYENFYFGIQKQSKDYHKMGKELINVLREKFWRCDNLENEEILQNIEDYLAQLVEKEIEKEQI